MKNWFIFFMTGFFGFLLFHAGDFFYLDFDFVVAEASSKLAPELSFAHWQLNTASVQNTKGYLSPEIAESTTRISKYQKKPVIFQPFSFSFKAFLIQFERNTFSLGYLPGFSLYLLNRVLRL